MTPSYQAVDQPPLLLEGFQRIGEEVLAGLPETFTRHLGGVVIKVEDFPDADTECAMELESLYDLLGLYHGVPVAHDLAFAQCEQPDMIFFVPKTAACLPVRPRLLTRRHYRKHAHP